MQPILKPCFKIKRGHWKTCRAKNAPYLGRTSPYPPFHWVPPPPGVLHLLVSPISVHAGKLLPWIFRDIGTRMCTAWVRNGKKIMSNFYWSGIWSAYICKWWREFCVLRHIRCVGVLVIDHLHVIELTRLSWLLSDFLEIFWLGFFHYWIFTYFLMDNYTTRRCPGGYWWSRSDTTSSKFCTESRTSSR